MLITAALFEPMQFVENLRYMGLGMLGIFIVIGAIALLTMLLNRLTGQETDGQPEQKG